MNSLEEENARLKAEIEELRKRNDFLRRQEKKAREYVKEFNEKYSDIIPGIASNGRITVLLDSIKYEDKPKPRLKINSSYIYFGKPTEKMAETAKVICTQNHLKQLKKGFVSAATIYEWFDNSEAWENIHKSEREQFKKDLYQHIYRLDKKISTKLKGSRLFEVVNDEYRLNHSLVIV